MPVYQKAKPIACLGPQGTHSEAAARYLFPNEQLNLCPTILAAINTIADQTSQLCVVPIENSIEGSINITLDKLASDDAFCIIEELVWPVRNHLMSANTTSQIEVVLSHPQALAQCRETLRKLYPQARIQETSSTSEAASIAARQPTAAAVAALAAAKVYSLAVRHKDIQDSAINCTRFVVIAPHSFQQAEKKAVKTSIVCELDGENPGTLYELLKEFALNKINLVRIESRPARTALGRYIFFLDFEGSTDSLTIKQAIQKVSTQTLWLRILGSYPVSKAEID